VFFAQIDFAFAGRASEEIEDAVSSLLHVWRQNGQIIGHDGSLIRYSEGLRASQMLPTRTSLQAKNNNVYAKQELARLKAMGVSRSKITLLGEEIGSCKPCSCKKRSSLILFTTETQIESPLSCGDCFGPVPLYTTPPISGEEHFEIVCWESAYQAIDALNMRCSVGERMAEREMGDVNGALSREGRAICEKITQKTGSPTYYFIYKHGGVSYATEKKRKCPGCGGKWLLKEKLRGTFDFRCDKCLLVSMFAGRLRSDKA
jgi:predicted  nucleic acid-binding Zn ribbon protein